MEQLHKDRDWWRQAVIYQIYPRSFADANGDGIGDIRGILSRLDYLSSLQVDAVWLSPFYPSALADGGYDVDDHCAVDPRLGTLQDVRNLIDALHDRDIRVFVDIVPNHSSDRHRWFQEALVSPPGSAARDRYIFRDGRGPSGELPPSDWPSHFGDSAWTRTLDPDGSPGQWYLHLFAKQQPDYNWQNPEVWAEYRATLRFWADLGVDGFRIDVAHALAKDLSEPLRSKPEIIPFDNPETGDDVLFDRNEVHEIYRDWRRVFDEYDPPRVAVAEAFVNASRRPLYCRPDELHQVFNFDLLNSRFDAAQYRDVITETLEISARTDTSPTWVLSNHDNVRHATRYGLPPDCDYDEWLMTGGSYPPLDAAIGLKRARAATLLLLALPGSTYLYQGEELGLHEVADLDPSLLEDPIWERSRHTKKGRDGCRVPLPWAPSGPSLGFGSGAPHLPQPTFFADASVMTQEQTPGSTLQMYRDAIRVRRSAIAGEHFAWLDHESTEVLHFDRGGGWRSVTNFADEPAALPAGRIIAASTPITDDSLPGATTVWLSTLDD
ncbi:glycoside hydrolase family 13 protein [Agromyces sp. M3QZ16-3]|uniref:glycoside hydrolase family 13 protein n=1 Tax=Agromyces sp. M3QZ16-3 TaxID=3447585 RepID=UPI003F68C2F4